MAADSKPKKTICVILLLTVLTRCCNAGVKKYKQEVCKGKACKVPAYKKVAFDAEEKNILCLYGKTIKVNGSKYIAIRIIGKGGSAVICKVTDAQNGGTKVIKIIEKKSTPSFNEFEAENEAEIHRKLAHASGIVKLYNVENRLDALLIVMEYVPDDLYDRIKPYFNEGNGAMPKALVLNIAEKTLKSLKQMHDKAIAHLDLKSYNVMITDNESVRIIDFGASMMTDRDNKAFKTKKKRITLFYSAPELFNETYTSFNTYGCERKTKHEADRANTIEFQVGDLHWTTLLSDLYDSDLPNKDCNHQTKVGLPADVWSFGILLYEMMYGKTPFELILDLQERFAAYNYETVFDVVMPNGIITQFPTFTIDFPEYEDPILARMVKDCLQRDPKLRPTVNELLQRFK